MNTKLLIILFLPIILLSKHYEYEVSIFGVYCADITINYVDTLYNDQEAIKIEYNTQTRKGIEYFFFIDNLYTSIINKNNFNILSYNKKTKQPNVINNISTYNKNDSLFYINNNQLYNNQFYNIFTLLYVLQMDKNKRIKSLDFLEREGNIYNMKINKRNYNNLTKYSLSLKINNLLSNNSVVKNTDIFTWGLFLPNAKREIVVDPINKIITSCKFSIGLINVKAELK